MEDAVAALQQQERDKAREEREQRSALASAAFGPHEAPLRQPAAPSSETWARIERVSKARRQLEEAPAWRAEADAVRMASLRPPADILRESLGAASALALPLAFAAAEVIEERELGPVADADAEMMETAGEVAAAGGTSKSARAGRQRTLARLSSRMQALDARVASLLGTQREAVAALAAETSSRAGVALLPWRLPPQALPPPQQHVQLAPQSEASAALPEGLPAAQERLGATLPPIGGAAPPPPPKATQPTPPLTTPAAPSTLPARWRSKGGDVGAPATQWVRSLIAYTETHPIVLPGESYALDGGGSTQQQRCSVPFDDAGKAVRGPGVPMGGFTKVVFPAVAPATREDVALLERWVTDMLEEVALPAAARRRLRSRGASRAGSAVQAAAEGGGCKTAALGATGEADPDAAPGASSSASDAIDGALAVYDVAFDELRRQVAQGCRERGALLGSLWGHCLGLTATRQSLRHEGELRALLEDRGALEAAISQLQEVLRVAEGRLADSERQHGSEVGKLEREKRKLARGMVRTENVVRARDAAVRELNATLQEEVDARERVDDRLRDTEFELRSTSKALDRQGTDNERLQAALQALQRTLGERDESLEQGADEADQLRSELRRATCRGDEGEAKSLKLEMELMVERATVARLERELSDKAEFATRQGVLLKEKVEEAARLAADLTAADGRVRGVDKELADTARAKKQVDLVYERLCEDHERIKVRMEKLELTVETEREGAAKDLRTYNERRREMTKIARDLEVKVEAQQKREASLSKELEAAVAEIDLHRASLRKLSDAMRLTAADRAEGVIPASKAASKAGAKAAAKTSAAKPAAKAKPAATAAELSMLRDETRPKSEVDAEWRELGAEGRMMCTIGMCAQRLDKTQRALAESQRAREVARQRFETEVGVRQAKESAVYDEKRRNEKVVRQLNETSSDLKEAKRTIETLEKRSARTEGELRSTRTQLERASAQVESLKREVADHDELKRNNDRLQRDMNATRKGLEQEMQERQLFKREADELKERQKEAASEIHSLGSMSDNLLKQIDFLSSKLQVKEGECDKLEDELKATKASLAAETKARTVSDEERAIKSKQLAEARAAKARLERELRAATDRLNVSQFFLSGIASGDEDKAAAATMAGADGDAAVHSGDTVENVKRAAREQSAAAGALSAVEQAEAAAREEARDEAEARLRTIERERTEQQADFEAAEQTLQSRLEETAEDEDAREAAAADLEAARQARLDALRAMEEEKATLDADLAVMAEEDQVKSAAEQKRKEEHVPPLMQKLKVVMLSASANVLRKQLDREMRERVQAEADWVRESAVFETALYRQIKEARGAERSMCEELRRVMAELKHLRNGMEADREDLQRWEGAVGTRLSAYDARFVSRVDAGHQTSDAQMQMWLAYIERLPPAPPQPVTELERRKLIKTIVHVYGRRLEISGDVKSKQVSQGRFDVTKTDTVYESVKESFRTVYGVFDNSPAEKSMGEFLMACAKVRDDIKVTLFSRFAWLHQDRLSVDTYHFFLETLDCLRRLMGVNWRTVQREWEQGTAMVPMNFAFAYLANAYNTDEPEALPIQPRLMRICTASRTSSEMLVDLDQFLLLMVKEYNSGRCPVYPLVQPRNITAGVAEHQSRLVSLGL